MGVIITVSGSRVISASVLPGGAAVVAVPLNKTLDPVDRDMEGMACAILQKSTPNTIISTVL